MTTDGFVGAKGVVEVEVCLPHSGAVSFIDYNECDNLEVAPTRSPSAACPLSSNKCDFSVLTPGTFVANQAQLLSDACNMTVTSDGLNVNVFDSANIRSNDPSDDPDLGSPSQLCGGPGVGKGGVPGSPFPNCVPQGNIMVLQNTDYPESEPNDSPDGGCMIFTFDYPVTVTDFGVLDIEEENLVEITVSWL